MVEKVEKCDGVLLFPSEISTAVLPFRLQTVHSIDRDNTSLLTRNKTGLAWISFLQIYYSPEKYGILFS